MQCRTILQELRTAIKGGGGYVVGGHFTYADITMAVAANAINPIGPPFVK